MGCAKQNRNLELSLPTRIIIFILGFTDNMLFGGAIFGWPQLVYVLKLDGVFSNLCEDNGGVPEQNVTTDLSSSYHSDGKIIMGLDFNNVTRCNAYDATTDVTVNKNVTSDEWLQCPEQNERFALIYTIAVVCYGVPGVAVGFLLHFAGLRITRMLGGMMVAASFMCFSLTTFENPNWLFPATILLSIGGNQMRMSGMQFGDLFPQNRSTTITILTGVYAASASLFLLFSIAQKHDIALSFVCYCIGGFAFVSALLSFLMPRHHIPYEGEAEDMLEVKQKNIERYSTPLWGSLMTLSSNLHMYWFFIILFCINMYQQFYNVWVTASTCTQEEAGLYSTLFSYSNLVSVFCAPVGGMFTDYLVRKAKKDSNNRLRFMTKEIQANFLPLFLTTICGMVMQGCMFFFNPTAIILSLVCMIVVRPCVIAISTAYIRIRFPGDHFNRLLGIYCTVTSALMYFQYPVFQWAQRMYYIAQGVIAALVAFSLLNPIHLLCTSRVKQYVKARELPLTDNSL